jgi:peptidoglycan/LPS O-acetylase OafA/YrhL
VVVLAIVLRVAPVLLVPSLNWADEIFQATEQAHRLAYGTGLVLWEFQLGARSWLLPGSIAGLMSLARVVGDGPDYYLPMIASALATLGAVPAVGCFLWYTQPPPKGLGFTTARCIGEVCIAERAGGCRAVPMTPLPLPDPLVKLTGR